ncbi:cytochrome c oxidase subunit II transmembrane domain-containing protein [Wolbachia endosymbiont of Corcyra cephalonica]|uniref:cytochrome c oxidase subunit II transmembrane domain-containing protein n=1 Tax=Wolbachia endosymbiont of Corcyra cephalonica TaxID=218111 RepID=UPI0034E2BDE2
MDANSPTMEQIIFFHDHTIIIVLSIITFLLLTIISLFSNNYLNFNLNNNQIIEII